MTADPGTATIEAGLAPVLAAAMERFAVPGAAVGIVHGRAEHRLARGVTSIELPLDVDAQTLFQIGSTTKTYTATALMTLVEEGELDLEAPVRAYLPGFRLPDEAAAGQVTVRHLVTHTGGFHGDYFDDVGRGDDALRRVVRRMGKRTPQLTPVGTVWSYNNAGFYVLGRLLETLTGGRYEDVIKERILDPLGMERTFFFAEEIITYKTAIGHVSRPDGTVAIDRPWGAMRSVNPAGGLTSNVDDQLRYARFHLGHDAGAGTGAGGGAGKPPLGAATVRRMQEPLAPGGDISDAVGVSWLIEDVGPVRLVKHGGSINGHMSELVLVPGEGFAITVLTNGSRGHELGDVVVDWALSQLLGVRRPAPRFRDLGPGQADDYVGRYPMSSGHYVVTARDGGLLLTVEPSPEALAEEPELADRLPPPLPLAFVDDDQAIVQGDHRAGLKAQFLRESGTVTWLRFAGRISRRQP